MCKSCKWRSRGRLTGGLILSNCSEGPLGRANSNAGRLQGQRVSACGSAVAGEVLGEHCLGACTRALDWASAAAWEAAVKNGGLSDARGRSRGRVGRGGPLCTGSLIPADQGKQCVLKIE